MKKSKRRTNKPRKSKTAKRKHVGGNKIVFDNNSFKNLENIIKFFDKYPDATAKSNNGNPELSVLRYAIYYNNPDVVDYVLNKFDVITEDDQTFLNNQLTNAANRFDAANNIDILEESNINNRKTIISLLIEKGASPLPPFFSEFTNNEVKYNYIVQQCANHTKLNKHAFCQYKKYLDDKNITDNLKEQLKTNILNTHKVNTYYDNNNLPTDLHREYDYAKHLTSEFLGSKYDTQPQTTINNFNKTVNDMKNKRLMGL